MEEKMTPETLAYIFETTELLFVDNSIKKLTKILTHFKNDTLYFKKENDGYKLIYKK